MKITDDMLTEWRKQFEAEFPMPPDCVWTGKGYAQTHHKAWRAQAYAHIWDGFVAGRRTMPDRECEWKCDDVDNGTWESCCGEIWTFTDGGPVENGMLFCHRCGSKLKTASNGPTPQQLAALDRLAENERELGLDYMAGTDGEKM